MKLEDVTMCAIVGFLVYYLIVGALVGTRGIKILPGEWQSAMHSCSANGGLDHVEIGPMQLKHVCRNGVVKDVAHFQSDKK